MITVRDLAIGYGSTVLMRELSFRVEAGEVFAILGGSGSGKSTLMRVLAGLQPPIAGSVEIEGIGAPDLGAGPPAFGVMFQSGALFGSMTLEQNVALPLQKWTDLPADAVRAVAQARLRLVGLAGFEHHLPAEISGGMKRRAGIARALALDPNLMFLDEPGAGLDPVTSAELDELIVTLTNSLGVTTVLVTHELPSIFNLARHCIMLDKQARTIIARGDPRMLRDESTDPRVRRFFNRLARSA